MKKTTVYREHNRKTQCEYCKQYTLIKYNGSIRIIIDRLVDRLAIIKGTFCSLDCAIQYLQELKDKTSKWQDYEGES